VARLQTVSHPVAEAIIREAPRLASRVRVIPYPLIENGYGQSREASGGARKKEILFVGRVHPEKGLHLLIPAVAAIPRALLEDWRLVIVGPAEVRLGGGGGAYLQHLHTLAAPIADRVDWVGPVFDPAELAAIYRRASMFVYPSLADHGETFGLAPLEAMSHGCPPVVSSLACFRDFIQQNVDGLFFDHANGHPELQLSKQLEALITDEPFRARISAATLRKAGEYGLDRITSLFVDDFRSLLTAPNVPVGATS
jgi:glycosyltransferase involved in cell wall biosynthesis